MSTIDLESLRIKITVDYSDARKELANFNARLREQMKQITQITGLEVNQVNKQLNNIGKNVRVDTNGIKSAFRGLALEIGTIFAGIQIGRGIIGALQAASDAVESENLFKVSFQNDQAAIDSITAWSEELQDKLGINAIQLRNNVGLMNMMAGSMGITKDAARALSQDMGLLANDMASIYNMKETDAFDKLRAGLTGEIEGLQRLGININEAAVKQELLSIGAKKVGDDFSQADKVMARYNLIMRAVSLGQGDLARTMDSPTNQMRKLQNELKLLQVQFGYAFMPVLSIVIPILSRLITWLATAANYIAGFIKGVLSAFGLGSKKAAPVDSPATKYNNASGNIGSTGGTGGVGVGTPGAVGGAEKLTRANNKAADSYDKVGKAAKKAQDNLQGFDEIHQLKNDTSSASGGGAGSGGTGGGASGGIGGIGAGGIGNTIPIPDFGAADAGLEEFKKKMGDTATKAKQFIEDIATKVKDTTTKILKWWEEHKAQVLSVFAGLAAGVLTYYVIMEAPAFFAKMRKAMLALSASMAGISLPVLAVAIVVGLVIAAIVYLWNTNEDFRKAVINIWEGIKKAFLTVIDVILHIDKYWILFKAWLKMHWAAMVFDIQQRMDKVRAFINEKIENIKKFWQDLKDKVAAVWDGIKQSVSQKMNDIYNWVNSRIQNIKNSWESFKNTVANIWNNVTGSIRGAMDNIYNWVSTRVNWLGNIWNNFRNGMAEGFGNVATRVANVFRGVINNVISFINKGIDKINSLLDKIPRLPDSLGGGGIDFRIPPIQPLARGGIVDRPTLSLIGEAGREAVVPLENTSFVTTLANAVGNAVRSNVGGGQNTGDVTVVLKLNELELGKAVTKAQNSYNRLNGNTNLIF